MGPFAAHRFLCWDEHLGEANAVSVSTNSAWLAAREYGDMIYNGPRSTITERTVLVRGPDGATTRWKIRVEVWVKFIVDPES